jgi:predicted FMN-binding regulatory protein PaiB
VPARDSHADRLLDVVTRLTNLHEASRPRPWAASDAPRDFIQAQLRGIVGVRLPITRIDAKRKVSRNRKAEDRANVKEQLSGSDDARKRQVAALIPESRQIAPSAMSQKLPPLMLQRDRFRSWRLDNAAHDPVSPSS